MCLKATFPIIFKVKAVLQIRYFGLCDLFILSIRMFRDIFHQDYIDRGFTHYTFVILHCIY